MPIRAVLDTNIWVSALLNPGVARHIVDSFEVTSFTLCCADELLTELIHVVYRPKFAKKISEEQANRLINLIKTKADFVQIQHTPIVSRDLKDNMFLACAAIGLCDFLVTGDKKDLLVLGQYKQMKIVSPAQFLEILTG